MRGNQHRDTNLVERYEQRHDLAGQRGVEIACGLVSDQKLRFGDHRSGNTHTLLLPTRQTGWVRSLKG